MKIWDIGRVGNPLMGWSFSCVIAECLDLRATRSVSDLQRPNAPSLAERVEQEQAGRGPDGEQWIRHERSIPG